MMAIVRVRVETLPNCKRVAETTAVCMGLVWMPYVCTRVKDTPPDCNRMTVTLSLAQKKRSGLMTTSENIPLIS